MKTMRLRDSALLPGLSSSLLLSVSSLSCSAPLPLPLCDCLPSEVVVMAAIVEAVVLVSCTVERPMVTVVGVLVADREYPCVCSSVSTAPRNPARRSSAAEELRNFSIVSFELCCRVMRGGEELLHNVYVDLGEPYLHPHLSSSHCSSSSSNSVDYLSSPLYFYLPSCPTRVLTLYVTCVMRA